MRIQKLEKVVIHGELQPRYMRIEREGMIFAQACTRATYFAALAKFREEHPTEAAGLTDNPVGVPWEFPKHGGYAVLEVPRPGVLLVSGVFKNSSVPGFAEAVVDLCRTLEARTIELDCFAPVSHVWARAGFLTYRIEPWNPEYAPTRWFKGLGTPSVLYMRQHLGE